MQKDEGINTYYWDYKIAKPSLLGIDIIDALRNVYY